MSLKVLSVHPEVVTRALRAVKGTRKSQHFHGEARLGPLSKSYLMLTIEYVGMQPGNVNHEKNTVFGGKAVSCIQTGVLRASV